MMGLAIRQYGKVLAVKPVRNSRRTLSARDVAWAEDRARQLADMSTGYFDLVLTFDPFARTAQRANLGDTRNDVDSCILIK